jgi:hypothetical protein
MNGSPTCSGAPLSAVVGVVVPAVVEDTDPSAAVPLVDEPVVDVDAPPESSEHADTASTTTSSSKSDRPPLIAGRSP